MSTKKGSVGMENKLSIVFATSNLHKLQEINDISKSKNIEFVLPPAGFEPIENGYDFEQNSFIKAHCAASSSNRISLADDSGLCVEALNGEPGIYSARYASTPDERIDKLLKNMKGKSNRNAKFVCVMTLVDVYGNILTQQRGECCGQIANEAVGENGFGYDPIFIPDGYNITIAEMSEDLKNLISHRSIALNKILNYINSSVI